MGGANVQSLPGLRIHPSARDTPAREHQRVRALLVDDGKLNVAPKRRAGDIAPHARYMRRKSPPRFDLDQVGRRSLSGAFILTLIKSSAGELADAAV
jgi:hypothetical protein